MDMQQYMHRSADAAEEVGIRAVLAPYCGNQPIEKNSLDTLEDNESLIRMRHNSCNGRIKVRIGLHSLFDSSPEYFMQARELAKQYQVGLHTHSSGSPAEMKFVKEKYGKSPLECLHEWGFTGPDVVLAHCVWLSNNDLKILKETKTSVAHCPRSNMKKASGVARVPDLLKEGVHVGLGTDAIFSSNNLDMFEEMKFATLLHRTKWLDATLLPPRQVLRMATIGGAQALGMDHEIGSLEPEKKADLVTVDLHKLRLTPVLLGDNFNVDSHLAYAAHGDDVKDVIVDGKIIVKNGTIKTINENNVITNATQTAKKLLKKIKHSSDLKKG